MAPPRAPEGAPRDPESSGRRPPPRKYEAAGKEVVEVQSHHLDAEQVTRSGRMPAWEIWTAHRVYSLDARMICVRVVDLATGRSDTRHPFLGAQLVGGQMKNGELNELVVPVPPPGAEAVFQKKDKAGRIRLSVTSRVSRVLLHVQHVRVSPPQRETAWDSLTGGE